MPAWHFEIRSTWFRNGCARSTQHRRHPEGVHARVSKTAKLQFEMAAPLPIGGSSVFSGSCQTTRHHINLTKAKAVAGALESTVRLSVRPSSASCQACTTSSTPGDGHHNRCSPSSSSQSRAGPSGNNGASSNVHGGGEASSLVWKDASQPHQQGDRPQGHELPAAAAIGSESVGTVVICRWLGSNRRYLKRYQDWWTQNG